MPYRAFVVDQPGEDAFSAGVQQLDEQQLPPGEVTIDVEWSDVNYKDALATLPKGRVVTQYPMTIGIDLAGTVTASSDAGFQPGDAVLAFGHAIGTGHAGGFAERARLPADWVIALPAGLTTEEAMVYGTAGFTAAMSVHALEQGGVRPEAGPIIVPGATGGVGSTAVAMLAKLGYEVVASTGKADQHDWLKSLGAREVLSREEVAAESKRPLESERWAGAVDAVGGSTTAGILRATKRGGVVALSGLTGGAAIATTVMPFILRGASLVGIDSVECPAALRRELWGRLGADLKIDNLLDLVTARIGLDEIASFAQRMLQAEVTGRTLVRVW